MAVNGNPEPKRIKLTQEKDTKWEAAIDDGRSVSDSNGKTRQQTITISVYILPIIILFLILCIVNLILYYMK